MKHSIDSAHYIPHGPVHRRSQSSSITVTTPRGPVDRPVRQARHSCYLDAQTHQQQDGLQFALKEIARTFRIALEDAKTLTCNIILLIWQVEHATGATTNHQWRA